MHEIQRQTARQLNQPLALSSLFMVPLFLCNPCPWQKKTNNLWMLSATYKCLSIFSDQLYWVSCVKLESFWLVAIFQNSCVFLCSPQILGYVILRVPMFVCPIFHGLKLNLFTGGRPQGLSQLSFQWAFWHLRKGTFLWNGCPTKSLLMRVSFILPQDDCFVGVTYHV